MSTLLLTPLVLALLMAGSTDTVRSLEPARAVESRHQLLAEALQRFGAVDLEGRRWTFEVLRGRVVLIDFWATWCAPCLAELPQLRTLRSRYSRKDFEILGISLDATSRQSLVSWLNRNRIEWPQVHQRGAYSSELARLFSVNELPRSILIARDGTIAAVDARGQRLAGLVDLLVTHRTGDDQRAIGSNGPSSGGDKETGVRR